MKVRHYLLFLLLSLCILPLFLSACSDTPSGKHYESVEDFSHQNVGVDPGSIMYSFALQYLEDPQIFYFNSVSDICAALAAKKVDGILLDLPIAQYSINRYPAFRILGLLAEDNYGIIFNKNNTALCEEFNEYLSSLQQSGTLDRLKEKWLGTDDSLQYVDYSSAGSGERGSISFATTSSLGAPFSYVKEGVIVGLEIDLAVSFAKEYGYSITIQNYSATGLFDSVTSGKCDFGGCCLSITEERKKSVLFSDSYYRGGITLVVNDGGTVPQTPFLQKIAESFKKTFVVESRWKMILKGILNTLLITVSSVLCGTALGFLVFLLCRNGNKPANTVTSVCLWIIKGMPTVVLLMILFYLVFPRKGGLFVAIFAYSLIFSASVFNMLKLGTDTVPKGQTEAARALGFSSSAAFFRIVLPQACRVILPEFRNELVTHIKSTAIVGYIAVQDITQASDIIRSRTYEAFFPLIATAILYFLLAEILTGLVKRIEFKNDPRKRSKEKIMKGVNLL